MDNNFDKENIEFENDNTNINGEEPFGDECSKTPNEIIVENPKKSYWKKEIKEWLGSIVVALILVFIIRTFFFEMVQVSGPSMENTLHTGDKLVVVKLNYTPKQGDIVVFRPDQHPNEPYIKRVIATEGQTVYIDFDALGQNGIVYVDGEKISEDYIKNPTNRNGNVDFGTKENPLIVPKDCVFVMGDNRMQSHDGRSLDVSSFKDNAEDGDYKITYVNNETGDVLEKSIYYGCVHEDDIVGKAVFRWWPMSKFGKLK